MTENDGAAKLYQWFQIDVARAHVGIALSVEKAPEDLCELDERSFSRQGSGDIHPQCL